jgi:type I restriction enzyme S subunit
VWSGLRSFAEFKNGINFNKNQKGDEGILTIDVLNMYSKGVFVNLDKLYRVNKPVKDDHVLKFGDILFVRSSVKREGVGWASAFKEISAPVTFCGFIIRARLQDTQNSPEYVTYFLRTNFARELIISRGSQVTITNISQDSLGEIPVPFAPVAEQHKIVEEIERRFSIADEVEMTVDHSLKQSERLRQSILKAHLKANLSRRIQMMSQQVLYWSE